MQAFKQLGSQLGSRILNVGLIMVSGLLLSGCVVPVIVKSITDEVIAGEKIEKYKIDKPKAAIIEGVESIVVSYVHTDSNGDIIKTLPENATNFCKRYNKSRKTWAHQEIVKPVPSCLTTGQAGKTIKLVISENPADTTKGNTDPKIDATYTNLATNVTYKLDVNSSMTWYVIEEVVEMTYLIMTVNEDSYQDTVVSGAVGAG